ncbi:MAG TPA: TonB-dependent receptor [Bryobacteraceae bacterium]|nr:TonB-dependent receptor [Bryobacteraceae bacterium]
MFTRMFHLKRPWGGLLLCAAMVFPAVLLAQNDTAVLSGRVVDPSGLSVLGAHVRLTRQSTGATRETLSTSDGAYRLELIEPGDYALSVAAEGFKTQEYKPIHLQVAQASQLNVTLAIGVVSEHVSVSETVSVLDAVSVAQGTVVGEEKIKALPLNGRQFLQLALLSPGVNSGGMAVQQNAVRQGEVAGLSVAGSRTNDSAYLLDGVINTDPDYNALSYVPIVDTISEFRVQVAQYSAEYGRASGGQVNVLTQSGTNTWHAAGWEFLRNNDLDARPFNLTTQSNVPKFQRNQYGGLVGGAVVKNKLFGFFSYEALKTRQAAANLTTVSVPDALQRAGNFSEEAGTTTIYDPTTLNAGQRTPFPGNIIPATRIDPSVSTAMQVLPQPNVAGGFYINSSDVQVQNYGNYSARFDFQAMDTLKVFGRYSGSQENASLPVGLPLRANLDNATPQNVALGATKVISDSKVNDLRLGFSRLNFLFGLPELSFSVNGQPEQLPNFIVGQMNFGGAGPYAGAGQGGIGHARDNVYQIWDVFAWQHGRHALSFGAEYDKTQYVRYEYADPLGSLTFTKGYTNATGAAPKTGDLSGDATATALLGLPSTAVRTVGPNRMDGRQTNAAVFVQDDIRLTPSLTLNAGLRYEVSPPMSDDRYQMSSIDYGSAPPPMAIFAYGLQGIYSPKLFVCGKDGYPAGCAYTNWRNFSPRLGLAWSVDSKTVIRVGGGIYYGTQDGNTLLKMAQSLPTTYNQTLTFNAYVPQNPNLNVFGPAIVGSQAIQAASIDPHQGTPYSPQWSFNIQRSLKENMVLEVGYLGTGGIHLEQNVQLNNGLPGTAVKRPYYGLTLVPAVQAQLAFPMSSTIVPVSTINYFPHSAQSNYHALTARLERRFHAGFSLLNSFTWSKAISNAPQYRNAGGITGSENSPPQNSFDLSAERSLAYFNLKFRFVSTGVYDLPFGKGHKLAGNGLGATVLGGWHLSGILQLQSGFPFTINYKGDPINIGGGSGGILTRPNYVLNANGSPVDPNLSSGQRSTASWFNTGAFVQPINQFGAVGRNTMQGPGLGNIDTTIARTFHIYEKLNLQFRVEVFNIANHSNYNLIGRIVNDPTFGIVQNQLPPRQIQVGFKAEF